MALSQRFKDRFPLLCTLGVVSALLIAVLVMTLRKCEGVFTYSLDDPYIHLALARGIAHGHYGINPSEPSAPSSNFIWPLMLAPFAYLKGFDLVPFVYNVLFCLLMAWAAVACFTEIFKEDDDSGKPFRIAAWSIATVLASNGAAIAFTGMENPLQIYLTILVALGLIRVHKGLEPPRSLPVALALAPLVRYENLAITVCAGLYLFFAGKRRMAVTGVVVPIATLIGFCLFLKATGLGFVPTSMMAKSSFLARLGGLVPPGVSTSALVYVDETGGGSAFQNLLKNLGKGTVRPFWRFILLVAIFAFPRVSRRDMGLWLALVVPLVAHLLLSQSGYFRYQMYLHAYGIILLVFLRRQSPLVPLPRSSLPAGRLAVVAFFYVFARDPLNWLRDSGDGSACIFRQQHQMMRFVRDFYRKPVGVNDLGEVAFGSGQYVLDVWGLASQDALRARLEQNGQNEWIGSVVARHNVGLVMVYDSWVRRRPADWKLVAYMDLKVVHKSVSGTRVSFYVTPTEDAETVRRELVAFSKTIPPGMQVEMH